MNDLQITGISDTLLVSSYDAFTNSMQIICIICAVIAVILAMVVLLVLRAKKKEGIMELA